MCKQKIIDKIDSGEALVFSKIKLMITIIILIVTFTTAFAITKYRVDQLEKKICYIEENRRILKEVQMNVKQITNHLELEYIEVEK